MVLHVSSSVNTKWDYWDSTPAISKEIQSYLVLAMSFQCDYLSLLPLLAVSRSNQQVPSLSFCIRKGIKHVLILVLQTPSLYKGTKHGGRIYFSFSQLPSPVTKERFLSFSSTRVEISGLYLHLFKSTS